MSRVAGARFRRLEPLHAVGLACATGGVVALLSPTAVNGQRVDETLTVGTALGAQEASFERIADIEVARDGRIVVLDEGSGWISVFDRDGGFVRRFGGTGEGPSEFRYIGTAALSGDTLVVLDRNGGKLVYLTLDGTLLDTRRSSFSVHQHGFPLRLHPLPGGGLVLEGASGCSLPRREGEDTQWRLVAIAPGEATPIQRRDAGGALAVYGTDGGTFCTVLPLPFRARPLAAVRADGVLAFAPGGAPRVALYGDPAQSSTDSPAAMWFRKPPASTFELPASARDFTRRDRDAWQAATLEARSGPDVQGRVIRQLQEAMDAIDYPESWPAYDRLLYDTSGELWARRPPAVGANEAEWDVLRSDGTHRGTVRLPASLDVRVVSRSSVYGIDKGEWDEDLVRRFDVRWN